MSEQRQKLIEQIDRFLQKAERVKATHRPNPPNVISSVTLDDGLFAEWKSGAANLLLRIAGEESTYYKDFDSKVKYPARHLVDIGIGILRALREDVQEGNFPESKAMPGITAAGGGGGGGGGGAGGGRGGDGGGVVIGIPPEQIGIQHVRDPHKQYWRKFAIDLWGWFQQHILTAVIVGLIIAGLVYWLGWN